MKPLDAFFLKRIYELTFLSSLWVAAFLLIGKYFTQGFSYLFGTALGILLLIFMERVVKKLTATASHSKASKNSVLAWLLIKYPALGILFYFLVRWESFDLAFFALGLTMPYIIIFLKGIGMLKTEKTAHA